jgi:hypothetical protein
MANKIVLKKSSVAAKVPLSADLEVGEIAVNLTDQKLYSKKTDGTVILVGSGVSGGGDVVGAASSTDNALARYDGTTGKLIQNSTVTIDDNGNANNLNAISFDTTPATLPTSEGSMYWDADKGAVAFVMQGGDVVQEIGESQYLYIQASANITKGQVVMFTGAIGGSGIPTGAPATGVTDGTYIMGIAAEDITSGTSGFVQTFGILKPINTTGFTTGTILWYNPTVTGGFTSTKPTAPNIKVQLAAVTAGNSSGGAILIRISAGSELGGTDSNVNITSPASGNTLIYDATAGVWENANLTAGTGISVTNGAGSITVNNTGVTSVGGTGTVNGITLTGTVTTTGNLTLGGTLSGVSLTTQVSGTLPVANGGTNATSAADARTNLDVPTRTGGNASGTWGIAISGNAATATTATNQSGGTVNATTGTFSNQLLINYNIAAPANYYNALQQEIRATSGTAGIGLHRAGFSHCGIYHDATDTLKFNMNGGTVTLNASIGTVIGSGNYNSYALPIAGGSLTTGANSNLFIGRNSTATNYNSISLNGNPADASNMGFTGGGGGDTTLYINAPGQITLRTNSFAQTSTITAAGFQNPNSVRAPIFYDSNDTGYYVNPNDSSFIYYLNTNVGQEGTGAANSSTVGMVLRGNYNSNTWAHKFHKFDNGSGVPLYLSTTVGAGAWSARQGQVFGSFGSDSLYSQIFYDSNDTNFYVDPTAASRLNGNLHISINNATGGGLILADDGDIVDLNDGYCAMRFSAGVRIHSGNRTGGAVITLGSNGQIIANDNVRSPYFADSNNTAFYCNPAGLSVMYSLRLQTNEWIQDSVAFNRIYFTQGDGTMIRGYTGSWYIQMGSTSTTTTIIEGAGNFYTTGAVTAYWSDARLKKNIEKIKDWREILGKINGYRFEWNDLGLKILGDSREQELGVKVGVIAQEAKEALPQSAVVQLMQYESKTDGVLVPKKDINYDPENPYLTVQMEKYIPVLIEASKGLMDENEQLKATIQSLVDRITTLEKKGI